eukprot:m.84770 g.84770  ORF g.84770 m.84770 type:complete len:211 (-) comp16355_c0_seq1:159-791(-)
MTESVPPCFHNVEKSVGEELIINGANADGDAHILRPKNGGTNEMILSLMYKGAPTHHVIARNDDGVWTINKKAFGGHTDLNDLLAELAVPGVKGWPIPLVNPVNNPMSDGDGGDDVAEADAADPEVAAEPDAPMEEDVPETTDEPTGDADDSAEADDTKSLSTAPESEPEAPTSVTHVVPTRIYRSLPLSCSLNQSFVPESRSALRMPHG